MLLHASPHVKGWAQSNEQNITWDVWAATIIWLVHNILELSGANDF